MTDEARVLEVGDIVEWTLRIGGTDRGVVSSVTDGRVYVRNQRTGTRGRSKNKIYNCEFWWDAHEVGELRRTVKS